MGLWPHRLNTTFFLSLCRLFGFVYVLSFSLLAFRLQSPPLLLSSLVDHRVGCVKGEHCAFTMRLSSTWEIFLAKSKVLYISSPGGRHSTQNQRNRCLNSWLFKNVIYRKSHSTSIVKRWLVNYCSCSELDIYLVPHNILV